eukprot:CAMPEP_0172538044 /NCGR_PEP_ID=MMETSP1067-20121228/9525_1 /TAXON_ID=265564 ORGANISM="Thalassiosira punctigera, Strain Tpunct2005C2" /NCGR_SAMPLE_ID=MMETSP1067 /ASSEMBLY_ACC=CAM_ASM_000444 /LENGTH=974 /DNA_ID=CAMNT_0013323463 /DNA_START=215 /DNA_END=3139 /DNA_ORIENTATION=+
MAQPQISGESMAIMDDGSESSLPRSTLANTSGNDERVWSSAREEGEGASIASSSVSGDVDREAETADTDEAQGSLPANDHPCELKVVEGTGEGPIKGPSRSLPPAEEDSTKGSSKGKPYVDIKDHHSPQHHCKDLDLSPKKKNSFPVAFYECGDSNIRVSSRQVLICEPSSVDDDVIKREDTASQKDGISKVCLSNFGGEQNVNGKNHDVSKILTREDLNEDAKARVFARLEEATARAALGGGGGRVAPLPPETWGHEGVDDELQELHIMPQEPSQTHPQPAAQGEEREDHEEESPSILNAELMDFIDSTPTTPTARERVGAFRVFSDGRVVERLGPLSQTDDGLLLTRATRPVPRGSIHDDDVEVGGMNNTNHSADAAEIYTVEASLFDDSLVEAHPIHLTHVPISSIQQGDMNGAENDEKKSEQNRRVSRALLLCVAVAVTVAVGAYLGAEEEDKNNGFSSSSGSFFIEDGKMRGSEKEVSSTTGEEGERVESTDTSAPDLPSHDYEPPLDAQAMVSSVQSIEPLNASQDTDIATSQTSSSSKTTALAPTEANDIPPIIWKQVGSNIPGVSAKNRAGFAVASSNDGKIIAIGSPYNDDVATKAGHVRIFAWNNSTNDWTQRGSTLLGEMEGDQFGYSLALSGSGNTVVCGAPFHEKNDSGQVKVFKWNETLADYVALGLLHNHNRYTWEQWGWDVDLSEDGLRVAVGAPGENWIEGISFARVFEWNTITMDWSTMGKGLIYGEQSKDRFGSSVSLSADGETLAVGAYAHNDISGEEDVGKTYVFKWDHDMSDWVQSGSGIYGEAAGDWGGWSTDLSADGKTLATSSLLHDGANGKESGHVRVYFWDKKVSDWAQMGSDIDGKDEFDRFGVQLQLSDDGKTIAITSVLNSDNGLTSGHCRVFQWSDSLQDWAQVGQDIQGESSAKTRGVALSGNGRTVVVGAWGELEGIGRGAGHVRVFNSSQWEPSEHDVFN